MEKVRYNVFLHKGPLCPQSFREQEVEIHAQH